MLSLTMIKIKEKVMGSKILSACVIKENPEQKGKYDVAITVREDGKDVLRIVPCELEGKEIGPGRSVHFQKGNPVAIVEQGELKAKRIENLYEAGKIFIATRCNKAGFLNYLQNDTNVANPSELEEAVVLNKEYKMNDGLKPQLGKFILFGAFEQLADIEKGMADVRDDLRNIRMAEQSRGFQIYTYNHFNSVINDLKGRTGGTVPIKDLFGIALKDVEKQFDQNKNKAIDAVPRHEEMDEYYGRQAESQTDDEDTKTEGMGR